mgnify:CR=1 FL=1
MRVPIFTKLFISLFTTSLFLVVGMTFFVSYSFKSGFQEYLNQQEKKEAEQIIPVIREYYSSKYGWERVKEQPELWMEVFIKLNLPFPRHDGMRLGPRMGPGSDINLRADVEPNFRLGDDYRRQDKTMLEEFGPISHRLYLENEHHRWVVGAKPPINHDVDTDWLRLPIKVNEKTVGWLVLRQKNLLDGPLVLQFYAQQQSNLFWIICLAGLASLLVALGLVRHFLSPLKRLQRGANALSEGNYGFTFEGNSNDEFGELASRFQYLAGSLQRQKDSREQWLVDISHELRTPIAVLRSELEAIQDGIRKPEMKRMDSMHQQVMGLRRLVDDLYLLSKTDSGVYQLDLQAFDIVTLVQCVTSRFEHRAEQKGLSLTMDVPASVIIQGDAKTLEQLCVNLLENSIRYTDAPGCIKISILEEKGSVVLRFVDSSPSVAPEHLPKLFGRLYRVDQSRSRSFGGSGLGLSICQNIVMMHGGSVVAEASELGGLAINVRLKRE